MESRSILTYSGLAKSKKRAQSHLISIKNSNINYIFVDNDNRFTINLLWFTLSCLIEFERNRERMIFATCFTLLSLRH